MALIKVRVRSRIRDSGTRNSIDQCSVPEDQENMLKCSKIIQCRSYREHASRVATFRMQRPFQMNTQINNSVLKAICAAETNQ